MLCIHPNCEHGADMMLLLGCASQMAQMVIHTDPCEAALCSYLVLLLCVPRPEHGMREMLCFPHTGQNMGTHLHATPRGQPLPGHCTRRQA